MEKIIEAKNISLAYQTRDMEVLALEDVSFSVYEGEFVSIIGPSGCGKSSLLSLMANLKEPTSGNIEIYTPNKQRDIAYMFQRDLLLPWRTIENNSFLGLEVRKELTEENKAFVRELLKSYGLYKFKDSYPDELSGGMRQRASLIRTLALKPKVLLLDEPFSALDYQTRLAVSDDIYKIIKKEKKTAVMVSHDISEAVSMSDKVLVMSHRPGKIKSVYEIKFKGGRKSPVKCREKEEFKDYFNSIWRDIDVRI